MSLNPWSELRKARETIGRLERDREFLSRTLDRKESYERDLTAMIDRYEDKINKQGAEILDMSRHLSSVWRLMQEWKPARVVKMYEEDK